MKKKLSTAIFLAASIFTMSSCEWLFGEKEPTSSVKTIIGKWTIENIDDSSKQQMNSMSMLLFAMASQDSLPGIEFRPDGGFTLFNKHELLDSGKYYLDAGAKTLFIKVDTISTPLLIKNQTDSSLQLFSSTDSIWYVLKK